MPLLPFYLDLLVLFSSTSCSWRGFAQFPHPESWWNRWYILWGNWYTGSCAFVAQGRPRDCADLRPDQPQWKQSPGEAPGSHWCRSVCLYLQEYCGSGLACHQVGHRGWAKITFSSLFHVLSLVLCFCTCFDFTDVFYLLISRVGLWQVSRCWKKWIFAVKAQR